MPRKIYIKPRTRTQKARASHRAQTKEGILKKSFSFSYRMYIGALVLCAAMYVYVFMLSPWFTVTTVTVRVEHGTAQDQQIVEEALLQYFSEGESHISFKRQILLVTKKKVASVINQVMAFHTLSIDRVFPHELRISLALQAPEAIWREVDGREYYVSTSGDVLRLKKADDLTQDAFLVEKATGTPVVLLPGAHAVDRDYLQTVKAFRDAFHASTQDFTLSKVIYDPREPQTLKIVTSEGWMVFVDQTTHMPSAVATLTKVLREMIGVNRLKLQYVDLRVENKVFYK